MNHKRIKPSCTSFPCFTPLAIVPKRGSSMQRQIITAAASTAIVITAATLGATAALGAHPVAWPIKIALIGAPIGAVIAIILALIITARIPRIITFLALMLIAYFLAENGHKDFAASYAEDQTAGKFWFFGWIATCAAASALLSAIAGR